MCSRPTCRALCSSTAPHLRLTTPNCAGRWRSAWIIKRLSTSSLWDRATLEARCSRRPKGCGGCRRRCSEPCPATIPTWRKTAWRRDIMEKLGYGPDNRLAIKVSARNIARTRDPAVLLTGQLKEIYIDGELEMVDTTNWFPKVLRKDFTVGMVVSENGLDDPDQNFYENYACGAARNYGGYCNQEVDALIDRQSMESEPEKRRRLVWDIEKKLIEHDVRPALFHPRATVCNQPSVKGMTQMVNGIHNGSRFEDVWLVRRRPESRHGPRRHKAIPASSVSPWP